MTEDKKPSRQYKKRAPKASPEAEQLFSDEYIPSDQRTDPREYDVDDIFAEFDESQDLRSDKSEKTVKPNAYFAKKDGNVKEEIVESTREGVNPGSPKVQGTVLEDMIRAEEMAADLVKQRGRFIEGVDNAKPGVPFRAVESNIYAPEMPLPYADQQSIRSDGVVLSNIGVLDTGDGAQVVEEMPKPGDRDDPASPHFMVCVNKNCRYREGCLRYRMHNKRSMKTVFFPEDCRRDGIYINVEAHPYDAYDPMEILESNSTPSF